MSTITIFKPADVDLQVVEGDPPQDQSAQVAALTAQLATVTAERDALAAKIAAAKVEADQAVLETQQARDALE